MADRNKFFPATKRGDSLLRTRNKAYDLSTGLTFILVLTSLIFTDNIYCQSKTEGYYKDLFMDGGVNLTSRKTLPAAEYLNLSMEYIATGDEILQTTIMVNNSLDYNGVLLYPDGGPRFRVIYTNGGAATKHGRSLTETGRENIRTFFSNGGSFTGSCAGAFIASLHSVSDAAPKEEYYHLWPGYALNTGLTDTRSGHFIVPNSPLLQYYDFGMDNYVDDVYHNGGCYAGEGNMPAGTEILARYNHPAVLNKPSVWAYKDGTNTKGGRVVVIGSHPEAITSGERRDLMAAILLYALDGQGKSQIKSSLKNGETRIMDKSTSDKDPDFTKIGDKQYHHFTIDLPEGASSLTLNITGDDKYDLSLYVNRDNFAFNSNAIYKDTTAGAHKTLVMSVLPRGKYYISIECETTVSFRVSQNGASEFYEYTDNLDVLNGVAYTIKAYWSATTDIYNIDTDGWRIYPNPFSSFITLQSDLNSPVEEITIFNLQGNTIYKQMIMSPSSNINIEPGNNLQPGVYYLRIKTANQVYAKKIIKIAN